MKLIDKQFEEEFIKAETSGINEMNARSLLENALTQQFRKLAMGMFSYTYLKEKQYFSLQTLFDIQGDYFDDKYVYSDFKNKFTLGIVRKEWPIIPIGLLNEVEIRIFNKYVKLFGSHDINEQLARLHSSFRVFVASVEDLAMSQIESIIGVDSKRSFDGRFIYGKITNLSATYFGTLYDFEEEVAVSPYFEANTPGFTIEGTTVIRRNVLYKLHDIKEKNIHEIASIYEHTWVHEVLHGVSYSFGLGLPFASLFWNAYLKRDIVRFFETPHTREEGEKAIVDFLNHFIESVGEMYGKNDIKKSIEEKCKDYGTMFSELISDRSIIKKSNHKNGVYQSLFALEEKQCEVC
jgi:hypothetical protein